MVKVVPNTEVCATGYVRQLRKVQGLGTHASCSNCWLDLLDLYSHTLSLQDIRLFKVVTTQVWISTFLLEHTTYKDHT